MYNTYMFDEKEVLSNRAHQESLVGQNRVITLWLIIVNGKRNTERKGEGILVFGEW